jgi:hypothetical protein
MEYRDQTFEGVTVTLDGNSYHHCSFQDVLFQYSGGSLAMEGCRMDQIRFQFGGDLANGLFALYQLFGSDGMIQILRGFMEPKPGVFELAPKSD